MIGTTASLAIGAVLVTLFVGPSLQRLRKLMESLSQVRVPSRIRPRDHGNPLAQANVARAEEWERNRKQAIEALRELAPAYTIAYKEAKTLGTILIVILLIMINTIPSDFSISLRIRVLLHFVLSGAVCGFFYYVHRQLFPDPGRVFSHEYLVSQIGIGFHPENLFDIAEIRPVVEITDDSIRLSLGSQFYLTGYKFFLMLTDGNEQRYYFIGYGETTGDTPTIKTHLAGGFQHYSFPVGLFRFASRQPRDVRLFAQLFVFLPEPLGWKLGDPLHPRVCRIEVSHGNDIVLGAGGYCEWSSADPCVTYKRSGKLVQEWTITVDGRADCQRGSRRVLAQFASVLSQSVQFGVLSNPQGYDI